MLCGERAHALAAVGIVRDILGNDVKRAGYRFVRARNALFLVYVRYRKLRYRRVVFFVLSKNKFGERLQSLLARNRSTGLALGAVGAVNIIDLGKRFCRIDGAFQLRRELFLRGDKSLDLLAPFFDAAQIVQTVKQVAQDGIV